MKDKRIIIPASLWGKVLNLQNMSHIGIEKTRLPAHKSIYYININADMEDTVKNALHILIPRQQSQRAKQYHNNTREAMRICWS